MSNNTTEQALIQIERNLEKLDSARNQVLNVTQSGQEIAAIMIDLVKRVQALYDVINQESESFISGFSTNHKKLDDNTSEMIKRANASTAFFLEHLNGFSSQFSENLNKNNDLTLSKTEELIGKQDIAFNKHISNLNNFNVILENFKKSILDANIVNEFKLIVEQNNLYYEQINEKNIENFKPLQSKLDKIEVNQKAQLEFSETLINLLNTVNDNNLNYHRANTEQIKIVINKLNSNQVKIYLTWLLIVIGFLVSIYCSKRF